MDFSDQSIPTPPTGMSTPQRPGMSIAELSPPSSQLDPSGDPSLESPSLPSTTTMNTASGANANGKRPLHTIDDTPPTTSAISTGPTGATMADANGSNSNGKVHTHAPTGYTWSRPEDEPGYAWRNKRAQEDFARAQEGVMKERAVGNRYGDPFLMADRELTLGYDLE